MLLSLISYHLSSDTARSHPVLVARLHRHLDQRGDLAPRPRPLHHALQQPHLPHSLAHVLQSLRRRRLRRAGPPSVSAQRFTLAQLSAQLSAQRLSLAHLGEGKLWWLQEVLNGYRELQEHDELELSLGSGLENLRGG